MGDLIDLAARRLAASEHTSGKACCRSCGYEWVAVVEHRKEGNDPNLKLQCPHCRRFFGVLKYDYAPANEPVRCCGFCDNQLFYVTQAGVFCPRCGRYEGHG